MDTEKIKRLNQLWMPVYPFLAKWVKQYCPTGIELTLELGPFSGGISIGLKTVFPGLKSFFLTPQEEIALLLREQFGKGLEGIVGPLDRLPVKQVFDLVLFRGAFFFLNQSILKQVHAALNTGGIAILGGGYGPLTPAREIEKVADESRKLNAELGKRRVSKESLWSMVQSAGISEESTIIEEGGLWLVIDGHSVAGGRKQ